VDRCNARAIGAVEMIIDDDDNDDDGDDDEDDDDDDDDRKKNNFTRKQYCCRMASSKLRHCVNVVTQTMTHTVESCAISKLGDDLIRLHSENNDALKSLHNVPAKAFVGSVAQ